ncbi:GntR family transcriptional regulator [Pseudomonas sp. G11-1]|uniref:GntR family transcriptional regulator n=2 Tax=Halopseudomonas bauzanensis TaxID=653930 RepID=A0A4U0YLH7_9GAMM|nr:GntR family transcriptional regulator [Pseudomonas sp. G11-1]MCO5788842.1 GntR family transcriptional regulator [Pseudomonas sp. G11-2]TKA91016.1 GntR family transcriptional regulator [Halopseudomonas bauzanensis]
MRMPARMRPDERLPLYQQLSDEMLARIAAGEWLPGTPIPSETELTRLHGVAIGTVRKAVDTLVKQGILERNHGRGTFVRRPQFAESFFRFFRQVSPTGNQPVPQSRILTRSLELPPEAVRHSLALEKNEPTVYLTRERIIQEDRLFREEIWLPKDRFSPLLDIDPTQFANMLYPFYEERCGQLIASARETLTIESADKHMAKLLGIAAGEPVVAVERIALGYDATPLEYRLSRGAAEGFRYQIDLR